MKQVEPQALWPSCEDWVPALLGYTPEEIADRFGICFERGLDDLDEYDLAALDGGAIGQVWLFRHLRSPKPWTEIQVDFAIPREEALRTVRNLMGLAPDDFAWVSEFEHAPDAART